ncbi:MAG TPA: phytoene/squalene synthase family protein, partial [Gammaproteobacteria bacterium]|nr:phytoene/squalene synthase family protein [Gammaproteobacteria bacterium]
LPERLAQVVANAYLLCRLADTIEDDVGLNNEQKSEFHRRFVAIVRGEEAAEPFADDLLPLLSSRALDDERDLVASTATVIRVTASFSPAERDALTRCVSIMCAGMPEFQRRKSLRGLKDLDEMADYCYVVAGGVGEMLTEFFCVHCPDLESRRDEMMRLAILFGQGLQMTNILKDIWDDRLADTCWLPRSVFAGGDFRLENLDEFHDSEVFRAGLDELIGITHRHLRGALEYTLCVPGRETGIRKFCLWAIGLAVLTLRKLHAHPEFTSGQQVKISRRSVKATVLATNLALGSDRALRSLFALATTGLPLQSADSDPEIRPAARPQEGLDAGHL